MILVDTSVWVDHFHRHNEHLDQLLENDQVSVHDYVVGELACGHLLDRAKVFDSFSRLPKAPIISLKELLHFIEVNDLIGSGLNFVDMHLLASTHMVPELRLWSMDRRLQQAAENTAVGRFLH